MTRELTIGSMCSGGPASFCITICLKRYTNLKLLLFEWQPIVVYPLYATRAAASNLMKIVSKRTLFKRRLYLCSASVVQKYADIIERYVCAAQIVATYRTLGYERVWYTLSYPRGRIISLSYYSSASFSSSILPVLTLRGQVVYAMKRRVDLQE